MADAKISALTGASTPLAGTEVLPIVQSSTTVKVSVANLTAGRDIATKQIASTVSGLTTALDGWNITNGVASAIFKLSGATYGYRGIGSNYVWIGGDGSPMYIGTSTAEPVRMGTNAFQQLTLETTGDVTVNTGNLVIGTAGKGIDFTQDPNPAGMTSELLDDYEEGTFTPTVIGTTTAGTATYANQLGKYTKVGRLVTVEIYLNWNTGTGAGTLAFGGLPFTIGSNVYGSAPIWGEIALTALHYLTTRLLSGGTTIDPFNSPVGGGVTNPVAYVASGSVMITATYST
jgi:hypothetical protein